MFYVSCNFYLNLLQGVRIIFLRMSNNLSCTSIEIGERYHLLW